MVKLKLRYLLIIFGMYFVFLVDVCALVAPVDITKMDIYDLQEAMDDGLLTSELLVNLYLDRIEKYDDMFNSINQINEDAISEARKLDQERKEGKVRSKLHGIPILVKTNIDVVGLATTAGTKDLKDNYPLEDAYVIKRLKEAGAIILGSTNMSELAFSASNSYSSYGYVKNVFNTDFTPFGSSGGSAVAVAASFAAASLGTDTNSSVRVPASGAGLVGIRPTLGLVSRTGVIPYDIERDTVGVMTKTVRDNSLILSIISGEDKDDSYTGNVKAYDDFSLGEKKLEDYTIGVVTDFVYGKENASVPANKLTDESIKILLDNSLDKLEQAGANIVYIDKFLTSYYYQISTSTYAGITLCDSFNQYIKGTTGSIRSFQQLVASSGHVQSLSGYALGCNGRYQDKSVRDEKKSEYRDYVDNIFEVYDIDVLLYPTLKNNVFAYNKTGIVSPSSSLSSVIGYPSITVPMGFASDGFSYGIEFLSKAYEEAKLYDIALEYEDVIGNDVMNSPLTPSLYTVSSDVQKLIELYKNGNCWSTSYSCGDVQKLIELYKNDQVLKSNEELYDEVVNYFNSYNSYEDDQATILLEKYEDYQRKLFRRRMMHVVVIIVIGLMIFLFLKNSKKKSRKKRKRNLK